MKFFLWCAAAFALIGSSLCSGAVHQALEFDPAVAAQKQFAVRLPDLAINSQQFTMAAWLWVNAGSTWGDILTLQNNVGYSSWSADKTTLCMRRTSRGRLHLTHSGTMIDDFTDHLHIPEEEWVHVAIVGDGSTLIGYVSSASYGDRSETSGEAYPPGFFQHGQYINNQIGGDGWDTKWFFNGKMDNVQLWNTALTGPELQSVRSGNPRTTNLVISYCFDGLGISPSLPATLLDSSGNDFHATIETTGVSGVTVTDAELPPACVMETCDDETQNQNEDGVDCGGVCEPCAPPPTCEDGSQNQDEIEVDCGGPCAECPCDGEESQICHVLAMCSGTSTPTTHPTGFSVAGSDDKFKCACFPEQLGHGYGANGCATKGWNVRVVYQKVFPAGQKGSLTEAEEENLLLLMGGISCTKGSIDDCDHVYYTTHQNYALNHLGANVLFPDTDAGKAAAESAVIAFNANAPGGRRSGSYPSEVDPTVGARLYTWSSGTTANPIKVLPSGMELETVHFEPSCADTGCWILNVAFTVGHSDFEVPDLVKGFNTFYLPYAIGNDALSYDYSYSGVSDTFLPANFPCRTLDYVGGDIISAQTLCCFGSPYGESTALGGDPTAGFLGNYRPTEAFKAYAEPLGSDPNCMTTMPETVEPDYADGIEFWAINQQFTGLPKSPGITSVVVVDSYIGQYKATIELDEKELRTQAGMLTGTVGVEHTVDTFIGYANFKAATGTPVLDSLATQASIHLEKTSFFSVSTHGTNDYTFLQYVNLRLVAIYQQDSDFSGLDEASIRTVRTEQSDAAHYIQVTFTVGDKYGVNDMGGGKYSDGLIPWDSVRAGQGTFLDSSTLRHKCKDWENADDSFADGDKAIFDNSFYSTQDCAPNAVMCLSPDTIPDQFVSFNIPLGVDWFLPASGTLANNVFVDLVINAQDNNAVAAEAGGADAPNDGGKAHQMKTTLTASIPIVEGGINIFCDGITAKTDLKDVADADLIIGSATDLAELSRLTIFTNIASTNLDEVSSPEIDTDSIESGLMTLIIKGNSTYFTQSTATSGYSLQLEDVITVHIMEDRVCSTSPESGPSFSCVFNEVKALVAEAMDENDGDTDGYNLNAAFRFRIDRVRQRAYLEPTQALKDLCPFSPAPPAGNNVPLETCVLRRDVRYRGFPHKVGGWSTAMEINVGATLDDEARFMQTVLGKSDYADQLGRDYATAIANRYAALGQTLDGRYNRAFWINPGYEWTPTQTGGESIFTLSQQILLFALINLDEGYVAPTVCETMDGNDMDGDGICTFAPSDDLLTFNAARAACQAQGGDLASIHSTAQQAEAWAAVVNKGWQSENVFIGGYETSTQMVAASGWSWKDGSAVDYHNFATGQPDANSQDCLVIWEDQNGEWDNQGCGESKHFICKAPVTEPAVGADLHLPAGTRRRVLLSNVDSGASMAASSVSFNTSPKSMMASAFNVPEHRVATFKVNFQLTAAEACMSPTELQASLRGTLDDYLSTTASSIETVQVTGLTVDRGSEECEDPNAVRRSKSIRKLLSSFSSATAEVDMLVVFSPGTTATINLPDLAKMSGIEAVDAVDVPDQIEVSEEYVNPNPGKKETIVDPESSGGSESGGSSMGLIAGVCGGVGAVLLLALIALLYKRSKPEPRPAEIVNAVSVEDLKHQLQEEV